MHIKEACGEKKGGTENRTYHVPHEPQPLDRISHETVPCPRQRPRDGNVAHHVQKSDRQQRTVFLQSTDHAFLALRHEQKPLGADFAECGNGALDVFLRDELQPSIGLRTIGFWDDVDDVEDVDGSPRWLVGDYGVGCPHCDELTPLARDLGDL